MATVRYRHSDGTSITTNARRVLHRAAPPTGSGVSPRTQEATAAERPAPPPPGWPVEVMMRHLLDVRQVGRCAQVCRDWADASQSDVLWAHYCHALWRRLFYVPERIKQLSSAGNSREAYRQAITDSRRLELTLEELTSFEWNFRFKESAGADWMERDRWWNGEPATRVRFGSDGTATMEPPIDVGSGIPTIRWRWVSTAFCEPVSTRSAPLL